LYVTFCSFVKVCTLSSSVISLLGHNCCYIPMFY